MKPPCYVVLANPDSKRWEFYSRDLLAFWRRRGVEPDIVLLPWREVVPRLGILDGLWPDRAALVRLESPGRDREVREMLLEAGMFEEEGRAEPRKRPGSSLTRLGSPPSALGSPSLVHRGFCRTLRGLRTSLDKHPHLRPLACPLAVAELFDKEATCRRLAQAGLPCPPSLNQETPKSPRDLLEQLRLRRFKTAYVKLNTGSSAVGIAVVHALDDPPWAVTSMVRLGDEFHSTRRLRKIAGPELDDALRFLLREGAIVQEGIAMARIDGQNFDLRVVVIHSQIAFTIFRLSALPMTNLHLGGRRGPWDACRAQIPTRAWLDALDHCAEAAQLYDCTAVGVDVVFEHGYSRHFILEINAFGDFFPHLTDAAGRSVHETEIAMTAVRYAPIAQ